MSITPRGGAALAPEPAVPHGAAAAPGSPSARWRDPCHAAAFFWLPRAVAAGARAEQVVEVGRVILERLGCTKKRLLK